MMQPAMMQQGPTVVVVQQQVYQPFPYGCYMGLGITQMVLGVICIICYAVKLAAYSSIEGANQVLQIPGISGWYASIFIACIVLVVTGLIGVLMTPIKNKRVPLGWSWCGLSGFGSVASFYLWVVAACESYLGILIFVFMGVQDSYELRAAILTTYYSGIVATICGLVAMIITIVSYSVWCCKCCGTVHTDQDQTNATEMGQVAHPGYAQPQGYAQPNQGYDQPGYKY